MNAYVTLEEAKAYFIKRSKELNMQDERIFIGYDEEKHRTEKATLFIIGGKEKWIPNSLISDKDDGSIEIPFWFAEHEELEGFEV